MNVTDMLMLGDEEHGFNLNEEQLVKYIDRGPYFDTTATKNVTSLVGKTGHLNCRIKNLGNKTVSKRVKSNNNKVILIVFLNIRYLG